MKNIENNWNEQYIAWSKIVAAHGANSEQALNPTDPQLAVWLRRQRVLHKAGKLGGFEVGLLTNEGMDWSYGLSKPPTKATMARSETIAALIAYAELYSWTAVYGNPELSKKASALRTAANRNKLTKEQVADLSLAGFDFDWRNTKKANTWLANLAELDAYIARYGHANPKRHGDPHPKLANWIMWQREFYVQGKLEEWQIQKLLKRGVMLDPRWDSFKRQADALEAHHEAHGTCIVPEGHPLDDFVRRCLSQYRAGKLSDEKIGVLRHINFNFGYDRNKAKWFDHYDAMCDYRLEHGHCNVTTTKDAELAHFRDATRTAYKKGELPNYRVVLLDSIGFQWSQRVRRTWAEVIGDFMAYKEEHGHLAINSSDDLSQCVNNLRSAYNRGDLPEWKVKELNNLGFVWDLMAYKQAINNN